MKRFQWWVWLIAGIITIGAGFGILRLASPDKFQELFGS